MEPQVTEVSDSSPSATFVNWVQQALEQLNDLMLLKHHPLTLELQRDGNQPADEAVRRVRRELITAIKAQKPPADLPVNPQHARIYNLLQTHYVEGVTIQKASDKLNVSLRQAYRDLRRGEDGVAAYLWQHWPQHMHRSDTLTTLYPAENERLETQVQPADMRSVFERAQQAVSRLAEIHAVSTHVVWPPDPIVIVADPSVAHQVFVGILSHAVQQAQPGTLVLNLISLSTHVCLDAHFVAVPAGLESQGLDPMIVELASRSGWLLTQEKVGGNRLIRVSIPLGSRKSILVIDDNEGLGRLLERYLTGEACQVVQATSSADGLRMALDYAPSAIILDIMMPGVDGWEVLQTLHNQQRTASIPVVICSVLNDPQLAASLGAAQFLRKPVSREDIVDALGSLGVL